MSDTNTENLIIVGSLESEWLVLDCSGWAPVIESLWHFKKTETCRHIHALFLISWRPGPSQDSASGWFIARE